MTSEQSLESSSLDEYIRCETRHCSLTLSSDRSNKTIAGFLLSKNFARRWTEKGSVLQKLASSHRFWVREDKLNSRWKAAWAKKAALQKWMKKSGQRSVYWRKAETFGRRSLARSGSAVGPKLHPVHILFRLSHYESHFNQFFSDFHVLHWVNKGPLQKSKAWSLWQKLSIKYHHGISGMIGKDLISPKCLTTSPDASRHIFHFAPAMQWLYNMNMSQCWHLFTETYIDNVCKYSVRSYVVSFSCLSKFYWFDFFKQNPLRMTDDVSRKQRSRRNLGLRDSGLSNSALGPTSRRGKTWCYAWVSVVLRFAFLVVFFLKWAVQNNCDDPQQGTIWTTHLVGTDRDNFAAFSKETWFLKTCKEKVQKNEPSWQTSQGSLETKCHTWRLRRIKLEDPSLFQSSTLYSIFSSIRRLL